tara:strand:- start:918 stop:2426 length:1509 start_codon:yes stop_codon:yes gene_type:complete
MIKIFFLSAILYLVFRWDFEYERDHEKTGFLSHTCFSIFCGLSSVAFAIRVYENVFFHDILIHVGLFLILIPDFILQKLFEKNISLTFKIENESKKTSNKLIFLLVLSILIPEFSILFAVTSWKNKQKVKNYAPTDFSDTDQKLHSTLQIVWTASLFFWFLVPEIVTFIMTICLGISAAYYTKAGVDKIKHDWAFRNRLLYLKKAAEHQLHWSLIPDSVVRKIQHFSPLVLVIEISSCLYLSTLNDLLIIQVGLVSLLGFHLMVLASSGINFWKWMLSIASILCLSVTSEKYAIVEYHFYLYAIVFLYFFFVSKRTPTLAWLDSPISNFYKIEIQKKKEQPWEMINPYHFAPYDVCFSQNRFGFFPFQSKNLVGCLGAIRDNGMYDVLRDISENIDDENIAKSSAKQAIAQWGRSSIDEKRTLEIINWIINVKKNQDQRNKLIAVSSNMFSHIRNGYKNTVKENSIEEFERIKITHTKEFWSESLKRKIVLEEDSIVLENNV